jgi:thymidylate synthase ThyX
MFPYAVETFTAEEEDILRRYVTNLTSRSSPWSTCPKWSRERCSPGTRGRIRASAAVPRRVRGRARHHRRRQVDATVGLRRAEELYEKVFFEYGDDSVAQLGGVHLACEQASNVLTKVLEWGG